MSYMEKKTPLAIEVRGLRKSYGSVEAVRGIDLSVTEGGALALLGPNGAGKTTTVEILEGFLTRNSGKVSVLGFDPEKREREFLTQIGIVLQSTGIDPGLTVVETIKLYRGYYVHPRPIEEVIEVMELYEKRNTLVRRLSGGMRRRLDIAIALIGDPKLLFLDEPTTGFDPAIRRKTWQMLKALSSSGMTIFLTTHDMDEAQYLADQVAIIVNGELVIVDKPSMIAPSTTTISFCLPNETVQLPESFIAIATVVDDMTSFQTDNPTRSLYELTSWALEQNIQLKNVNVHQPSLEDMYVQIIKSAERKKI